MKSKNILLDKDYEAHLADFGIAKSLCTSKTHTSTYVMGTIGYIDPEYACTSRLNEKSDVYSYGIVLLELLTGKKPVDNECNLHHLVTIFSFACYCLFENLFLSFTIYSCIWGSISAQSWALSGLCSFKGTTHESYHVSRSIYTVADLVVCDSLYGWWKLYHNLPVSHKACHICPPPSIMWVNIYRQHTPVKNCS